MLLKALKIVTDQLRQSLKSTDPLGNAVDAPEYVVIGNIGKAESGTGTNVLQERTVLTLVNLDEESTLKNNIQYERIGNQTILRNPPVHLNLYLLFSANYDDYENALLRLSQVIEFFQGKRVFTFKNSPLAEYIDDEEVAEMKLVMDLHTLSFQEINFLWGSLGGKQVPYVLYRSRLVELQAPRISGKGGLIEEIETRGSVS